MELMPLFREDRSLMAEARVVLTSPSCPQNCPIPRLITVRGDGGEVRWLLCV